MKRQPEQLGQVERKQDVMGGVPVLAGTRIPTSSVWRFHRAGYSADAIMHEYPSLTQADIAAAIEFECRTRTHAR